MNLSETWELPGPDRGSEIKWHPVVRVGRVVPFGYMQDPNDPDIILPIERELELLEEAKKHLKKYSSREVAAWLSTQSGRSISHVGLLKRVRIEKNRQREATIYRNLAARYEKALKKAEELEAARIGGARTRTVTDSASTTSAGAY